MPNAQRRSAHFGVFGALPRQPDAPRRRQAPCRTGYWVAARSWHSTLTFSARGRSVARRRAITIGTQRLPEMPGPLQRIPRTSIRSGRGGVSSAMLGLPPHCTPARGRPSSPSIMTPPRGCAEVGAYLFVGCDSGQGFKLGPALYPVQPGPTSAITTVLERPCDQQGGTTFGRWTVRWRS